MECYNCNQDINLGLTEVEEAFINRELKGKAVLICIECYSEVDPKVKQVLPDPNPE